MMRFGLAVVAGAMLLTSAPPARATIIWRGDFEPGDFRQWSLGSFTDANGVKNPPDRRTIVMMPAREGKYAARIEIRPGDIGASNINRVELSVTQPSSTRQENAEVYYAWSVMLEKPFARASHQIAYWEGYKVFKQVMSWDLNGEDLTFTAKLPKFRSFKLGKATAGQWHDIVLHVKWSADPAVGFVELWYDGARLVPRTAAQTMFLDPDTGKALWSFFNHGVLRDKTITDTEVLFHDGAIAATDIADVTARYMIRDAPDGGATAGDAGARRDGGATPDGGASGDGGAGGGGAGGAGGGSGSGGSTSGPGDETGDHPLDLGDKDGGGCACRLAGHERRPGLGAALLLALAAARSLTRRGRRDCGRARL